MIIKIISTVSTLILLTTNIYASSGGVSLGYGIFAFAITYLLPFVICLYVINLIENNIRKIPSGKFKSLFITALITFVGSSSFAVWAYVKTSPPTKINRYTLPVSKPIKEIKLTPVSIPRIQPQTIKNIKDERCIGRSSNEPIGIIACSEG